MFIVLRGVRCLFGIGQQSTDARVQERNKTTNPFICVEAIEHIGNP